MSALDDMPPPREQPRFGPVSLIVTARNEPPDMLSATIDGLLRSTEGHDREVIVVDDGSDVPVESVPDAVQLIRNAEPVGVARARRQGAAAATGSVFVWLDAHMTFAPGWLDRMLAHAGSGSLLCSAYWDYGLSACYSWGADFEWCHDRNHGARRSPGFGLRYRRRPPGPGAFPVPMIVGACYMLHRRSYERLGGFSPFFRVWGVDEQDMSARAWLTGLGVKCVSDARVGHLCRPAFPYPVRYEHLEFNQIAMIRCLFERSTAEALERAFAPTPPDVRRWLDTTDVTAWRAAFQSQKQMSDLEFLRRFVPGFFWGFPSGRTERT